MKRRTRKKQQRRYERFKRNMYKRCHDMHDRVSDPKSWSWLIGFYSIAS